MSVCCAPIEHFLGRPPRMKPLEEYFARAFTLKCPTVHREFVYYSYFCVFFSCVTMAKLRFTTLFQTVPYTICSQPALAHGKCFRL